MHQTTNYGFVEFEHPADARAAHKRMHHERIRGDREGGKLNIQVRFYNKGLIV